MQKNAKEKLINSKKELHTTVSIHLEQEELDLVCIILTNLQKKKSGESAEAIMRLKKILRKYQLDKGSVSLHLHGVQLKWCKD